MSELERMWRLLLVDDEEAITANLAPFLERAGFSVSIASDGAQALDRVQHVPPDLIVVDALMPRLDGREALRRARPEQPPLATASLLQCGELKFDRRAQRVYLAAHEITLTPKATVLLEYLVTQPDELRTRERLLEAVWGWDYPAGTRTVDTCIAELCRTLSDDVNDPRYSETVPGVGYRFVGKVEGASSVYGRANLNLDNGNGRSDANE